MNKSKFLKKSLAMLLSIMMVVAMIPVGASAESVVAPLKDDILSLTAAGGELTGTYPTWTDTIAYNATGDTITVELGSAYDDVIYVIDDGDEETATGGAITFENDDKVIKFYAATDDYDADEGTGKKSGDFTINIVQTPASGSFAIESVKATYGNNKEIASADIKIDNSKQTIDIASPWGVEAVTVTATQEYPVADEDAPSVDIDLEDGTGTDTMKVYNQKGNGFTTYTVTVTEKKCLTSVSIDGVAGVLNTDEDDEDFGKYTVSFPVGTEFTADETELPVVVKTTDSKATLTWNGTTLVSGKEAVIKDTNTLVITDRDENEHAAYTVYAKVTDSSDTSITGFTVWADSKTGEQIRIDTEGKVSGTNLTVELPATVDIKLTTVEFEHKGKTIAVTATNGTDEQTAGDDGSFDLDLSKTWRVTVTAEDGTVTRYTLTATQAKDAAGVPQITAMKIKIGDTEFSGTIKQVSDETGTITFTGIPYSTEIADIKAAFNEASIAKSFGSIVYGTQDSMVEWGTDILSDKNYIYALSESDKLRTYEVKLSKAAAETGKTISNWTWTSAAEAEKVTDENTYSVSVANKVATVTVPYSLDQENTDVYPVFTLSKGAKLYKTAISAENEVLSGFYTEEEAEDSEDITAGAPKWTATKVSALDEEAKCTLIIADEYAVYEVTVLGKELSEADAKKHTTTLTTAVTQAPAKTGCSLTDITDEEGLVSTKISGDTVTITVPYSYTAFDGTDEDSLLDVTITTSPMASVKLGNTEVEKEVKVYFDQDDDDNWVLVYEGGTTDTEVSSITVTAENGANAKTYTSVVVKVEEPKTGALVKSFKVNGVSGTINNTDWTITANLPVGTDLTEVTVEIIGSDMSDIWVKDTDDADIDPDYTNWVWEYGKYYTAEDVTVDAAEIATVYVAAEDRLTVNTYTVTITASQTFVDVKTDDYFYAKVMKAAELGIVKGVGDNKFNPSGSVTREDFCVMLVRMLGVDVSSYTTHPFTDKVSSYAVGAVAYCAEKGYVSGYGDGTFKASNPITRQEAASVMKRALGLTTESTTLFTDDSKIDWGKSSIYACRAAGIFKGDEKGNFNPKNNITRADTAIIMVNASK